MSEGKQGICPICGKSIPVAELAKHVNACLDASVPPPPSQQQQSTSQMNSSQNNQHSQYSQHSQHSQCHVAHAVDVDADDDAGVVIVEENTVRCPICSFPFPKSQIQKHASRCTGEAPQQQQQEHKKPEPTFTCPLCKKYGQPLDICFRMDECGHPFCRTCISKYAQEQLFSAVTIRCPTCKAPFSIRDNKFLLPDKEKQKYTMPHQKINPQKRLMDEMRHLTESDCAKNGFSVEFKDDNLFEWEVKFFGFDKTDPIAQDVAKLPKGSQTIVLNIRFPPNYPLAPPYVRIIRPRFQFMTGHVTVGGSVCFEMLTSQGWEPQFTVESLLVSVRTNLVTGGARLDMSNRTDYSAKEAQDAFDRMLKTHGWK